MDDKYNNLPNALKYWDLGWSIIPIKPKTKEPLVKWTDYEVHQASKDEIIEWWSNHPDAGIAVVMGKVSNLIAVDVDNESLTSNLSSRGIIFDDNNTITEKTFRGKQYFFEYPPNGIKNKKFEWGEIRSDGCYSVIPPSIHPKDVPYEWITSPFECAPTDLQKELLEYVTTVSSIGGTTFNTESADSTTFILEGSRNTTLAKYAGVMRRVGMTETDIYINLDAINSIRCRPPLKKIEVEQIAKSISKYPPEPEINPLITMPLTDVGNAEAFCYQYKDKLRYDVTSEKWIIWNGNTWSTQSNKSITEFYIDLTREREYLARQFNDEKGTLSWLHKNESNAKIKAAIDLAKEMNPIRTNCQDYNQNPLLIACKNGVIDLKIGELRNGRPDDLISISTPIIYDENATCKRWSQFLKEIFEDDEVVSFIQKAVGYTLTGYTKEQCFFMLIGQGANGKSVFLNTLIGLLGEFSCPLPFTSIVSNPFDSNKIPNDLAKLFNKRLVVVSEAKENSKLNEARIKSLTGGDKISARFLYGEFFDFIPYCKLWLALNHKPEISDLSDAMWRRIILIPFNRQFLNENDDKDLGTKLKNELPGILSWAIEGCLLWLKEGLNPPESLIQSTKSYRAEQDIVKRFLDECTVVQVGADTAASPLYETFSTWCKDNNEEIVTQHKFGGRLTQLGYKKAKSGPGRHMAYKNLSLIN